MTPSQRSAPSGSESFAHRVAQQELVKGRHAAEAALKVTTFEVCKTADVRSTEVRQGDQLCAAIGPLLGDPHLVAVQMAEQARVVGCEMIWPPCGLVAGSWNSSTSLLDIAGWSLESSSSTAMSPPPG